MRKMIAMLALSVLAANVMAAVSPEEAAKLGTSLTPVGAEKPATPMARFRPGPAASPRMQARWIARGFSPTPSPVKNHCS